MLEHKKDWGPGFRFFACHDCGERWEDKSRNCESPSGDSCPNCGEWVQPHHHEPHYEWPTDAFGNLL